MSLDNDNITKNSNTLDRSERVGGLEVKDNRESVVVTFYSLGAQTISSKASGYGMSSVQASSLDRW